MTIGEATLVAYVDGQLDSAERGRVEAALVNDPAARDIVERLLRVSAREIKAGLSQQAGVPLALAQRIATAQTPLSKPWHHRSRTLAASLAILVVGLGVGFGIGHDFGGPQLTGPGSKPWEVQVAEYQKLYVRDTVNRTGLVNRTSLTGPELAAMTARLGQRLGRPVGPPDLTAHALAFKRGQLLDIDGHPLAQLVYLPDKGKPIALCVMATDEPDLDLQDGRAEGLNYTLWRQAGYAFIVIGDSDAGRLRAIAADARQQLPSG